MFSSALVCCLFVCLFTGLRKNYLVDFHIIRWKFGKRTAEEITKFGGNSDYHRRAVEAAIETGSDHREDLVIPGSEPEKRT